MLFLKKLNLFKWNLDKCFLGNKKKANYLNFDNLRALCNW